ncbi:MAG: helicase, partial [Candidatus Moranbacteria bacterium]|nr:helicase [Candidatus Moranbacteria bacterium]
LQTLTHLLKNLSEKKVNGGKVLIFSFYADTIEYFSQKLPEIMGEEWTKKTAFLSGRNMKDVDALTKRFAPMAKKYECQKEEQLDYLFATDILSEGQNLQDCGIIINYDLHWNPVRMIQRNGRINRLGTEHKEVYIYNMHPEEQLEAYLKLVKRLENKVERIRQTIGTDQSVLGEKENPLEYVDKLYSSEATEYSKTLEDDEGFLSEDEYIFDLRDFLNKATEEEKEALRRIPEGKWGYYPEKSIYNSQSPSVLSLARVYTGNAQEEAQTNAQSQEKDGRKKHRADIFVAYDKEDSSVNPLETLEALSLIRTTQEDSLFREDTFSYDKIFIQKLVEAQALD